MYAELTQSDPRLSADVNLAVIRVRPRPSADVNLR
jgi:hypothetical protein